MRLIIIFTAILLLIAFGLLVVVNICGANEGAVLGRLYWSSVTVLSETYRWTTYTACRVQDGRNFDCTSKHFAFGLQPNLIALPESVGVLNTNLFYYLTRAGYISLLVGVLFTFLTTTTVLGVLFGKSIFSTISAAFAIVGFILVAGGASCVTAAHVIVTTIYKNNGLVAQIGVAMFAVLWSSVFVLLMAVLVFFAARSRLTKYAVIEQNPVPQTPQNLDFQSPILLFQPDHSDARSVGQKYNVQGGYLPVNRDGIEGSSELVSFSDAHSDKSYRTEDDKIQSKEEELYDTETKEHSAKLEMCDCSSNNDEHQKPLASD